ncbi:hypothetical protein KAR91_29745 [Candidatus Pacearchaeota archaeon]|nr:hypothetical protein [Candidatus Pacearchaeota archaeon]
MKRVTIRIPEAVVEAMDKLEEKNSVIIRGAILHWLMEHEGLFALQSDKYGRLIYEPR